MPRSIPIALVVVDIIMMRVKSQRELWGGEQRTAVIYSPTLRGTSQNLCECSGTFERSRVPSRSFIFNDSGEAEFESHHLNGN